MLSTLTICLNEAEYIAHMLDFLIEVVRPDEIVIVDGGSTDNTIWIIDCYIRNGAPIKLIENPMPEDFSEQRNIALDNCSGDWILQIDADETYSKNISELIGKLDTKYKDISGFWFPTAHLIKDEFHMLDGGGDVHIRLFRNKARYVGKVHETPIIEGKKIQINKVALRHYSLLKSKEALIDKGKRWLKFNSLSSQAGIALTGENHFVDCVDNFNGQLYDVPKEWE